jgi:hypothetical protein
MTIRPVGRGGIAALSDSGGLAPSAEAMTDAQNSYRTLRLPP